MTGLDNSPQSILNRDGFLPVKMIKKLIIADDSKTARVSLRFMLKAFVSEAGIEAEIEEVENGAELVQKIQDEPLYDLVLTDYRMPIKNGLQAIREIRAENLLLPIYMVSSDESEDIEEQALSAGATGFLCKQDENVQKRLGEIVLKYLSKDWKLL